MNNQISNLLSRLINNNPQVQNNPQAKEFINALQNNDSQKGEQIANNILKTYGLTKEQALEQAKKYFGF